MIRRIALCIATVAFVFSTSHAVVDPAAERKAGQGRISSLRRQVEDLDIQLRAPGLTQRDYSALQDLRTNLEQERRILEERERVIERLEKSGVLLHISSPTAASLVAVSSVPAKTLWESGGWARFEGDLPCAGCQAVRTELTLYNDGNKYLMHERYLGQGSPKRTFVTEGLWTTLRGHGDDPDATVFELDYDKPGRERHFLRMSDDEIKVVDLDEKNLRKKHNLFLKRVAP